MKIKNVLKLLMSNQRIWKGIYQHYKDVPVTNKNYYDTDESINSALGTKAIGEEHTLLALLASVLCKDLGKVRILDFGGGLGITYTNLMNSTMGCSDIDYHIVETEKMCKMGKSLFKDNNKIHFHNSPPDLDNVDIVFMCSALQYIEDYASLLKTLCKYSSKYFLFTKLSAVDIPTYASIQKKGVSGFPTPYWFINIDEIIGIMREMGYELIFKGVLEREYNQDNFPVKYRMGRACNLLFQRK